MNVQISLTENGRGVITMKDFEEGEEVFSEDPFVLYPSIINQKDSFCFATLQSLQEPDIFCEGIQESKEVSQKVIEALKQRYKLASKEEIRSCECCSMLQFINEEMRLKAFKELLSAVCSRDCSNSPQLKKLLPTVFDPKVKQITKDPDEVENEIRPMDKETEQFEMITLMLAKITIDDSLWDSFVKHLAYTEKNPPRCLMEHEEKYLALLQNQFPKLKWLLTAKNFLRLKSAVAQNTFSVVTNSMGFSLSQSETKEYILNPTLSEGETKGNAIYKISSFLNHSCAPNIYPKSPNLNARLSWITSQRLEKGSELRIAYLAQEDPRENRQALFSKYGFVCHCEVCLALHGEDNEIFLERTVNYF